LVTSLGKKQLPKGSDAFRKQSFPNQGIKSKDEKGNNLLTKPLYCLLVAVGYLSAVIAYSVIPEYE